ncbi:hypothetical protein DFH06DRAFT_388351 [Mycena polygramma]|nr:hypothetical protein DFH06DRAFT_388351 [Mycena polygramma]
MASHAPKSRWTLSGWALEPEASSFAPSSKWSNADMDPVPEHLRTWTTWNYVAYWISDATNTVRWSIPCMIQPVAQPILTCHIGFMGLCALSVALGYQQEEIPTREKGIKQRNTIYT